MINEFIQNLMKSLDIQIHLFIIRISVQKPTLKDSSYMWKYLSSEKPSINNFSEALKLGKWRGWRHIGYLLVTSYQKKYEKFPKEWKSEMKVSFECVVLTYRRQECKIQNCFHCCVPSSEPFWTWWCIFCTSTKGCKWGGFYCIIDNNFFHQAWEGKQGVCDTVALPFTFLKKVS